MPITRAIIWPLSGPRVCPFLTPNAHSGDSVSVRVPATARTGADALRRQFETGGSRSNAAGINHLPREPLPESARHFEPALSPVSNTTKIKTRRTDHIPTVVLWWTHHGEGSVSPSASAKLGLQPLALPRHHLACAMPIQSGSRTCGTSFDSCATLRTCRKCKQSPMGCPIWREYVLPKRSHHV